MAEKEYIEREMVINEQKRFRGYLDNDMLNRLEIATRRIPAADVVPASDFRDCRNELCLKCGNYKQAHNGACDGCRWRDV